MRVESGERGAAAGRGPGAGDQGPGTGDQGSGVRGQGSGARDQGPGTRGQAAECGRQIINHQSSIINQLRSGWWEPAERALRWAGDRLNPILVKETRQALKSRQFGITFALLLICGWAWSILGIALSGPDIWYGAPGADMFFGYYAVLAFPLLVIVPFGAFRSLAGEQEDKTYELMSISTLTPRQIVGGKLGSAVLQMLIYLSAITPCLAFTYLLRGIDFPSILFVVFYTVLASIALAVVGLLAGTVTSEKHWQVVLSVFLVAGLLGTFLGSLGMVQEMINDLRGAFTDPEFWQANAAFLTGCLSYLVLLFYAAAAQITFPSDNRSTRLRVVMLVQHLLLTGWMAWLWLGPVQGEEELLLAYMISIGLHWYVMGMFMTGESPRLSPRVKRQLPQSYLGRVFFTWFNPGPGTGYLLVISSLLGAVVMVLVAIAVKPALGFSRIRPWGPVDTTQILAFGVLGLSYVTIYLGVGLLLTRLLRLFLRVEVLLTVLLQVLLVLLGLFVPWVVQAIAIGDPNYASFTWVEAPHWVGRLIELFTRFLVGGHSVTGVSSLPMIPLRAPDPICCLAHIFDGRNLPADALLLMVIVPGLALIVFVLNLPAVAREVHQVRAPKPQRVAEEDAQLAAEKAPPQPIRTSPWD
jgi:hypothetical protein